MPWKSIIEYIDIDDMVVTTMSKQQLTTMSKQQPHGIKIQKFDCLAKWQRTLDANYHAKDPNMKIKLFLKQKQKRKINPIKMYGFYTLL